jgi:hypothetical protein
MRHCQDVLVLDTETDLMAVPHQEVYWIRNGILHRTAGDHSGEVNRVETTPDQPTDSDPVPDAPTPDNGD